MSWITWELVALVAVIGFFAIIIVALIVAPKMPPKKSPLEQLGSVPPPPMWSTGPSPVFDDEEKKR